MGRLRLTREARSAVVVVSGGSSITAGAWSLFGHGWGLVVGGVLGAAYGLVLMETDDLEEE